MEKNQVKNNLNLVVAKGKNNEIGFKNNLIWRIKEDLSFFKNVTMDSYIIMGRNTYESMPKKLPGRRYIVLSRQKGLDILPGQLVFNNLEEILNFISEEKDSKFHVVGGGIIYNLFLPFVSQMHITEIDKEFKEADTFFPSFDESDWIQEKGNILYCPDNNVMYQHTLYLRKNNRE